MNKFIKVFWIVLLVVLIVGVGVYFIGLYNVFMVFNEKGYYFIIMLFGLFLVVSL